MVIRHRLRMDNVFNYKVPFIPIIFFQFSFASFILDRFAKPKSNKAKGQYQLSKGKFQLLVCVMSVMQ